MNGDRVKWMPSTVTDIQNVDPEELINTHSRDKPSLDDENRTKSNRKKLFLHDE